MNYIYRIENEKGVGPYRGGDPLDMAESFRHTSRCGRPTPCMDKDFKAWWNIKGFYEAWRWSFGFKSIDQLRRWFSDKEIKELEKHGFYVVAIPRFMIDRIKVGSKQVIFEYR